MKEKIEEYRKQDNACTAYPIYIAVQELQFVGVIDEEYGHAGDCEIVYEYSYADHEEAPFKTKTECVENLREHMNGCSKKEIRDAIDSIYELPRLYRWTDIEFFLTHKGADEYLSMDNHNLGKTRKYVRHFSRKNLEMRELLEYAGFPTSDNAR